MTTGFKFDTSCDASTPYHGESGQFEIITDMVAIRINEYTTIPMSRDEYESICETASILNDADMMDAIRLGEQQIAQGDVIPWDQAKRELGL